MTRTASPLSRGKGVRWERGPGGEVPRVTPLPFGEAGRGPHGRGGQGERAQEAAS